MRGKHSRKRPIWARPAGVGLVAIVLLVAAAGLWLHSSHKKAATHTAATAATTVPRTVPPTTATHQTVESTTVPAQTTTSVAPSTTIPIGPPVIGADSFTYTIPAGTPITVTAVKPCWIQARATAGGPVLTETTLQAGQTSQFTSPLWLRLGDPTSVTVTAGTTPLKLPILSGDLIVVP